MHKGCKKCLKCGRFMRRVRDCKIWICRCGEWIAEIMDTKTMMAVANTFWVPQR